MATFAERAGYAVQVLKTYNPLQPCDAAVPVNTCFLTWEHSCHTASRFELVHEEPLITAHTTDFAAALCQHAKTIHTALGVSSRIASDCEFVPTYAQSLTAALVSQKVVTLTRTRTFAQLTRDDSDLQIDWEKIASNPRDYPACFLNTRKTEYTFLFEKFLHNGKCKGLQSLNTEERKHSYTNSAGLSLDRLYYRAGAKLPTRIQGKQTCIFRCEESEVDKNVTTLHPFKLRCDIRTLFTDKCTKAGRRGSGLIYAHNRESPLVREVGVWTKTNGYLFCTLFHNLPRIIVAKQSVAKSVSSHPMQM